MAIDPVTGKQTKIQLSYDKLKSLKTTGIGRILEASSVLPQVLIRPSAVFEGLTREQEQDRRGHGWRCYCGTPDHCFEDDGKQYPAPPGQVFLVFINDDGIAYNWRWEKADGANAGLPIGYATRFQRRLL